MFSTPCIFLFLPELGVLSPCFTSHVSHIPTFHSYRRSTRRRTTSSCCTEATSTTPAVPISGLTVWSLNPQASYCLTCSELFDCGCHGNGAGANQHQIGGAAGRLALHRLSPWAESDRTMFKVTQSFCNYSLVFVL